MDRVHAFFLTKIISKIYIPGDFAEGSLCFSIINPQSVISQKGHSKLKNNSRKVLSLQKIHIFPPTTPNLVILAPKFSGSLLLSFYTFI
jgi:hypothetical protein